MEEKILFWNMVVEIGGKNGSLVLEYRLDVSKLESGGFHWPCSQRPIWEC